MIDGVIKYAIEHTNTLVPAFKGYESLEALRSRLFTLGLIGVQDGIGYGNISSREESKKSFFITATQTGDLKDLSEEYYTYVNSYDFSRFLVNSQGIRQSSSEALSHAMIYAIDSEINAVIHVHSKALWEFMIKNDSLYTTAEYGTIEMVQEIASLYKGKNPFEDSVFVMRGHKDGIMAFGKSVKEAELRLYAKIREFLSGV